MNQNDIRPAEARQEARPGREAKYATEAAFYKGKSELELRFLCETLGKEPSSFRSGSRLRTLRQHAMNVADDMARLLRHLDEIEGGQR